MDELKFIAKKLSDAGDDFTEAGADVGFAKDAYRPRGNMNGNPFGLVQGASDELHQKYGEFYASLLTELDDMHDALVAGSTDLKLSSTNYTAANKASTPS